MTATITKLHPNASVTQDGDMTKHYLSTTQIAERLGVTRGALGTLKLPKPDVTIGEVRGWSEKTIDDWNESRPGRGRSWDDVKKKGTK